MKSTEKETQKACLDLLSVKRIFHYRQNSGTFQGAGGGFYRFGTPGAPDIIAVIKGIYVGIEVKDKFTKQNKNQVKFQEKLESAGGKYIVIRDVIELNNFLKS